jgi:deazaflavin-dependent oxidoreductase (nitroreductase family)
MMKIFTSLHAFFYRLTGGKIGSTMGSTKVLLISTRGRKSGKTRTNPVNYFERDGGYLIVASNAGRPYHPRWYLNLKANPQVTVQIKDMIFPAIAEILTSDQRPSAWKAVIEAAPAFAGYESRTSREIPLILLKPQDQPGH